MKKGHQGEMPILIYVIDEGGSPSRNKVLSKGFRTGKKVNNFASPGPRFLNACGMLGGTTRV